MDVTDQTERPAPDRLAGRAVVLLAVSAFALLAVMGVVLLADLFGGR